MLGHIILRYLNKHYIYLIKLRRKDNERENTMEEERA